MCVMLLNGKEGKELESWAEREVLVQIQNCTEEEVSCPDQWRKGEQGLKRPVGNVGHSGQGLFKESKWGSLRVANRMSYRKALLRVPINKRMLDRNPSGFQVGPIKSHHPGRFHQTCTQPGNGVPEPRAGELAEEARKRGP